MEPEAEVYGHVMDLFDCINNHLRTEGINDWVDRNRTKLYNTLTEVVEIRKILDS